MKHFFALPALLRVTLVLASQHAFSVQDDILAFPQYEIKFSEQYVPEEEVAEKLREGSQGAPVSETDVGHHAPVTSHEGSEAGSTPHERIGYEVLLLDEQKYLCSIPIVAPPEQPPVADNVTQTQADTARELARANERGWELLAGMQGQCTYFISGWWSYRFCYGEGVRQFHQLPPGKGGQIYPPVEDPSVEGYTLGMFEGGKTSEVKGKNSDEVGELVTKGESRYLVQRLEGGTVCDLTGKQRRVEVQFHCNPSTGSDRISLIKEIATCAYLMVIQTPRLCNDIAFQPPQVEAANSVICSPIFSLEQAEAHEKHLDTLLPEASELTVPEIWATNPDAAVAFGVPVPSPIQVAGDIIIGGHAIVPPGLKLEKSAIVGGGKEKFIETIADSDGHMLDQESLAKMGLGNAKDVEALKKELEDIAKGGKWKLDVVETPRGREYRGIIDDGKDEEEGKGSEKAESGKEESGQDEGRSAEVEVAEEGVAEQHMDQVKQKLPLRDSRTNGKGESAEKGKEEEKEGEQGSEEEFYREEL